MVARVVDPISTILCHLSNNQNFVLQGGAGSGKTETLMQVVQTLTQAECPKKVACITHTNKAADEIADRASGSKSISTIHSFLGNLIRPYKRNIKSVLPEIFILPHFERLGDDENGATKKDKQKSEKDRFDKAYEKLTTRRLAVLNSKTDKVVGKRDYDKDPDSYVSTFNTLVDDINQSIKQKLEAVDPNSIKYNETPFDSFKDASYSHDGLIQIASLLIERYPFLRKIISDKYDYIFIDEYQDTHPDVVRSLVLASSENSMCLGLFGDSEQAIYSDGIGDVRSYIERGSLSLVEKEDNFRCSQPVIDVANSFRCDGLQQNLALKKNADNTLEEIDDREGSAKLYYAWAPKKQALPNEKPAETTKRYKEEYRIQRDCLITAVAKKHPNFTQLKLTNKSIATDAGFGGLWEIFDNNLPDPRDRIKKLLNRLQFEQLFELIKMYRSLRGDRRSYNKLIRAINQSGCSIQKVEDKNTISENLKYLSNVNVGAYEAIEFAIKNRFISMSDSHKSYISNMRDFLIEFDADEQMTEFSELTSAGENTQLRMKKALKKQPKTHLFIETIDNDFETLKRKLKKYQFLKELFSKDLSISEVIAFYQYELEEGYFATMHKTKGTGINDVIVVCDEYDWTQYDFGSCFSGAEPSTKREIQSRKLLYVACSRTKSNLVAVRLISNEDELRYLETVFSDIEKIDLQKEV